MTARRRDGEQLLPGEWACLGIICQAPAHGFAIAARLAPAGDIGRIWSMSRALTYRALDQLGTRGLITAVGEEQGIAGGSRVVLAATRLGRSRLRAWLRRPVEHLRDLRSELLLKLVLAEQLGVDTTDLLTAQHDRVAELFVVLAARAEGSADVVDLWRRESCRAAVRFLDDLTKRCVEPQRAVSSVESEVTRSGSAPRGSST